MSLIGKISIFTGFRVRIIEEDTGYKYYFYTDEYPGFHELELVDGEIVRFTVVKPCGGKYQVDTISKLKFPE